MALGPQFKNTYWTDEQGSTQYSLSSTAVPFAVGRYNFYPKEVGPRARKTFIPTQGMLFSPETGTGAKNDPLVPHERRIQAIKKSLGMNDPDKYAKRAGYSMNSSPRSSKKPLGKRATKKANAQDPYHTQHFNAQVKHKPFTEVMPNAVNSGNAYLGLILSKYWL